MKKVSLIRHFKVKIKWKFIFNSFEFSEYLKQYDAIINLEVREIKISEKPGIVISSDLPRARLTVEKLFENNF